MDHSYAPSDVEKESSCSEEGVQKYECTDCGSIKTESIEKLAHSFGETFVTKEPNCSEEGERSATCTVCGASQEVEKITTNGVHIFTNNVVREATCTDLGEGVNTCSLCQHSETCQYELKPHTYGNAETVKKATCTENGTKNSACTECGKIREETLAAEGHKWTGATCMTEGVCSVCGITGSKGNHNNIVTVDEKLSNTYAGRRIEKCQICGEIQATYYTDKGVVDLRAMEEEVAAYARERGFNVSYEDAGRTDYICSLGVWEMNQLYREPSYLVGKAKNSINYAYDTYASSPAGIGAYTAHIRANYGQSGAFGGGSFTISIAITS